MAETRSSPRADLLSTATVVGFVAFTIVRMFFPKVRPILGFFITVAFIFCMGLLYRLISESVSGILGELRQITELHKQTLKSLELAASAVNMSTSKKELKEEPDERQPASA